MSKRLLAGLPLILAAVILAAAAPASAHTDIADSVPADGEILTVLPERFSVTATETLNDLTGAGDGFGLHILGPDGARLDTGEVRIEGRVASTPAVVGAPGAYRLAYQVVGEDGHPVTGEIGFVWAPPGSADVTSATNAGDAQAATVADAGLPLWPIIAAAGAAAAILIAVAVVAVRRRQS